MKIYTRFFKDIDNTQVQEVGGKNASLGEMYQKLTQRGVKVPNGFAIKAKGYWRFLEHNGLFTVLEQTLSQLDIANFNNLSEIGQACRSSILAGELPLDLRREIESAYATLEDERNMPFGVAVRSSATAEDLPSASFAGQQESYLNVQEQDLLSTIVNCYASLFTDRAIKYRCDNGFEHKKVALSACVQHMVRSDLASSGVAFTLDPETGFRNVVYLTGSWGLGENVVQGTVNPDEFYLYKPNLEKGKKAILSKKLGEKAITMVYANSSKGNSKTANVDTPFEKRKNYVLSEKELEKLGRWFLLIENHYAKPMDIEWAKDGFTGELFIVQARPETVHSRKTAQTSRVEYLMKSHVEPIATGVAVGDRVACGVARILEAPSESWKLKEGEILVTSVTNPDWDPILKKTSAIVTNKGGRTSHAAIVAREAGAIAVVGTLDATSTIKDGEWITVSCAEGKMGKVYKGKMEWEEKQVDYAHLKMPKTSPMFILGDPDKAFELSQLPNKGIGLMRMEFVITNSVKIHPMALVEYHSMPENGTKKEIDEITFGYERKEEFFVEKLSQAIGTTAAAFYPNDVIVRLSDFKSNEYANLIGGQLYEPEEENPMIGFRGASRYYNEQYKKGFELECRALKVVREEMGFHNVKVMVPFCRTVEEGKKVIAIMEDAGLKQGNNELEIYVMCEIPSNVILAEEFADIFDGFSIGSNDLTQLTLGIDRDSTLVSGLFDENNEAVKRSIASVIKRVKAKGKKIGICGQGPSDSPEFAQFLIEAGINSISFNPDAYLKGLDNIVKAEVFNESVMV